MMTHPIHRKNVEGYDLEHSANVLPNNKGKDGVISGGRKERIYKWSTKLCRGNNE